MKALSDIQTIQMAAEVQLFWQQRSEAGRGVKKVPAPVSAALPVALLSEVRGPVGHFDVVVVGAGVVGLCTAWNLLQNSRGRPIRVAVVEASPPDPLVSTTAYSTGKVSFLHYTETYSQLSAEVGRDYLAMNVAGMRSIEEIVGMLKNSSG